MDDIDRLLNLLETLADTIATMTDTEVNEELAQFETNMCSVGEVIQRALERHRSRQWDV